jgi:hypothetical protein
MGELVRTLTKAALGLILFSIIMMILTSWIWLPLWFIFG